MLTGYHSLISYYFHSQIVNKQNSVLYLPPRECVVLSSVHTYIQKTKALVLAGPYHPCVERDCVLGPGLSLSVEMKEEIRVRISFL